MLKPIIVVEDDPFTKEFYNYLFKKTGYDCIQTEDGDQVIKTLETEEISLVILDINLKETYLNGKKTDGVELSRTIKQNEKINGVPVLLVTAYTNKSGGRNYFDDSLADDYITKPVTDFNKLLGKINSLIK